MYRDDRGAKMKSDGPNEILRHHSRWLKGEAGGERADFSGANLSGAHMAYATLKNTNLSGADLSDVAFYCADLSGANLSGANLGNAILTSAILEGANLSCANLSCAILTGAILTRANLTRANLEGAILSGANLENANLEGAILTRANLSCANLSRAILTGANLSGANLYGAILTDAILPEFQIPQSGDLTGFKKVRGGIILELLIPDGARRTGSLIGNKCRCERALVVRSLNSDLKEFRSIHDPAFVYKVGEFVEEKSYNGDPRYECEAGIHFFMKREEAEGY